MEEEGEIEETNPLQEPLFRLLSDSSQLESANSPNPKYEDGKVLPKKLRTRFLQEARPCVPLEEIDPYFHKKQTFVVIGRWGTIHRFSSNSDGYLTPGPGNIIRRVGIYISTNWIFSTLIVATILMNIIALMKIQTYEIKLSIDSNHKKGWIVDTMTVVNYVCLAVYCFELGLKVIAKGLLGDEFTCLRDPWVWLDIIVIWTGFYQYRSFILYWKSTLWLRIFKIIPLIPSVRQAGRISVRALMELRGMLLLNGFLLWFFALICMQLYMGSLRQKCIKDAPEGITDAQWADHIMNTANWYNENYDMATCGNYSGTKACPDGYMCLQYFGFGNPDYGTTNFDGIVWSLLSVIRIASEDFTEELYRQIVQTSGPANIILFVAIFFIITLPMGCLFFGILGNFFDESKASTELEMEEITALADVHEFDAGQNPEALVITTKNVDASEELVGFRKALNSFVFSKWVRNFLVCTIIIDIVVILANHYGLAESEMHYKLLTKILPIMVFLIYTVEFLLKIISLGPAKYFKNRWNHLDFVVLLTFFLEIQSYFMHNSNYMLPPIRMLKLFQYWSVLRMLAAVYLKTLKSLSGWFFYTAIVLGFFVLIGPFEIGQFDLERVRNESSGEIKTINDIPRWTYVDFWRSFRSVVRMQFAEWIETFWECHRSAGANCFLFYLGANLCGGLLISFILIGIVFSTLRELQGTYDPKTVRGLRLLLRKICAFLYSPIKRIQPKDTTKNGSENPPSEPGLEEQGKKPEGERRKKSIVAESTNQLREVMQHCTTHWAYKIACCAVIIIASLAMICENHHASEQLRTGLFVIEILFTVAFVVVIVYELLSFGIKESVTNRGWLFDVLIILEMILNLTVLQFSVTGKFLVGMFCVRSFRPLMLISRIDWLRACFKGLKYEIKILWEVILGVLFVWLFFAAFGVHWLMGLYHKCMDAAGHEVRYDKVACLAKNLTWENSYFNFDNSQNGLINMVILASRMGWVQVVQDATDGVELDSARQPEVTKLWFIYFILFLFLGAMGGLGILFAHVYNKFKEDKGFYILLTEYQSSVYSESKGLKNGKRPCETSDDESVPEPESNCMIGLYNLVTNMKFGAFIMAVIILDNVALSLKYYSMSSTFEMVVDSIRLFVLVVFIGEMIVKLFAWRVHYFRSVWNWLDILVVFTAILDTFLWSFTPFLRVIRMLRLLRIFRFLQANNCGSQTIKLFFTSLFNIRHAFMNLVLFHLVIMWAFALMGNYKFSRVEHVAGLGEVINFDTFRSSFWTLTILLGFPALEGIYKGLAYDSDCMVKMDDNTTDRTCGYPNEALWYIGLYASITFLVLLNLYSVLISEIISEISRCKSDLCNDEDVALQEVSTDNGQVDGGESEAAEEGDDNAVTGEE